METNTEAELTIYKKGEVSYSTFSNLESAGITHGVFMRHGGCSPQPWSSLNLATSVGDSRENVIENRSRIMDTLGLGRDSIYDVWQVHSSRVIVAARPRKLEESHLQADAIVTNQPGVTILMLFADCVPMLFYDPRSRIVACAHGGWQGTFKGIAAETIRTMGERFQSKPAEIMAAIGPSIGVDHYEVGQDVVDAAGKLFNEREGVIIKNDGRCFANLQLANQIILERVGVKQIEQSGICTMCHDDDWFSHRGEHGKTGRFGAVISLYQNE